MSREELATYVVYRHPRDFPHSYVVRCHRIVPDHREPVPDPLPLAIGPTLEAVRAALPPFLYRLERHPDDEPQIVEVWL